MCHNRFQQPATKQAGPVQEMSAGQAGHNEGVRAFFEQKGAIQLCRWRESVKTGRSSGN